MSNSTYSKNKKAYHDYEILESFEAGIKLTGDEVKSIKGSQANLKGAFIEIIKDEAYLTEAHVSRYKNSCNFTFNPTRKRKLLLKIKEILKIARDTQQKGVTAIPLELYASKGLVKLKIGICRGKKQYDKRAALKKRGQEMEIKRSISKYQ